MVATDKQSDKKKHFVLVHGLCLGAWCWYKLAILLKMKQHKVTALDLGGCGIHPKQLEDISSMSDYLEPLLSFISSLPNDEKVVLVGHIYGGIPISLAMEKFPHKISLAVFISACMPKCNDSMAKVIQEYFKRGSEESLMDCRITFEREIPVSAIFGPDYMAVKLYQHCTLEDLELGKLLSRPGMFFLEELGNKYSLSKERYGRVKRGYIVCEDDQVMIEEFQMHNIENNPPHEVISIAGAGHMIMLSKAQRLCSALLELTKKHE